MTLLLTPATIIILIATCIVSIMAFNRDHLLERFLHIPYAVKYYNEHYRLLTHGLIHGSWMHLGFNMFVLYQFGRFTEANFAVHFGKMGSVYFVALYVSALIASSLYSQWKHQDNEYYRALGASGATSALVFTFIFLEPWAGMGLILLPIRFPAFIFGTLFVVISYFLAKRNMDNIGHEAHIGGAIYGLIFIMALDQAVLGGTMTETFLMKFEQGLATYRFGR